MVTVVVFEFSVMRCQPLRRALTGKMEIPKASEQRSLKMFRCGQCRHFERAKNNLKDLCGAWEKPTTATREACGFFMLRKPARDVKTPNEE
ncbi:hypothetical protein RNH93_003407 [Vibrio cholerae]|nr:hypothetical protein [Vibrio cholerae]